MDKEIRDLLKEKDICFGDLLFKVKDQNTGKEGWIDGGEIIENIADSISETSTEVIKSYLTSKKSEASQSD